MWEALTVAGLVAAFVAVAGLAGLTVYRLWTGTAPATATGDGTDATATGDGDGTDATSTDQRER